MGIAFELRNAISTIRDNLNPTCRFNGVTQAVVEGWLTAVENHLNQTPVDWAAIKISLNVLSRWIGRVDELRAAAEVFRLITTGGDQLTAAAVVPSEFEHWLWAPRLLDQVGIKESISNGADAITAFPPVAPR